MDCVGGCACQVVSHERWTRVHERLRASAGYLNCNRRNLCDGQRQSSTSALTGLYNCFQELLENCKSLTLRDVSWRKSRVRAGRLLLRSVAPGFAQVSSQALLGTGLLTVLPAPSFVFRFPASGSHGMTMTVRSKECRFALLHCAIISPLST